MTQTGPAATAGSLYEQVGGAEAVRSVVDGLYVRIMSDQQLAPYFTSVDISQQKRHMAALLSQILGGPKQYNGRDLHAAHAHLGIGNQQYNQVGRYLIGTLREVEAPENVVAAVGDVLVASRSQVVTRPGDTTSDRTEVI